MTLCGLSRIDAAISVAIQEGLKPLFGTVFVHLLGRLHIHAMCVVKVAVGAQGAVLTKTVTVMASVASDVVAVCSIRTDE